MGWGSKLGTGAVIAAGAAIAGYGFYEAGSGLTHLFNHFSAPVIKGACAAVGAVVGAAGLGTFAAKRWIEIQGAILTVVFGAAGALGGGIGGWELAAHHLVQPGDLKPAAVIQQATPTAPLQAPKLTQ